MASDIHFDSNLEWLRWLLGELSAVADKLEDLEQSEDGRFREALWKLVEVNTEALNELAKMVRKEQAAEERRTRSRL